ncbi:hypothetical protein NB16F75_32780 [Escherichia coli]
MYMHSKCNFKESEALVTDWEERVKGEEPFLYMHPSYNFKANQAAPARVSSGFVDGQHSL